MLSANSIFRNGKAALPWVAVAAIGGAGALLFVPTASSEKSIVAEAEVSIGASENFEPERTALRAFEPEPTSQSMPSQVGSEPPGGDSLDAEGKQCIRVYFATDRTRFDLNGAWIYLRLWLPVAFGVALISILVIGMAAGIRYFIAIPGILVAMLMTSFFAHQAGLGTQYVRLLSSSSRIAFGYTRLDSAERAYPLHLGFSDVSLPPGHVRGELERPRFFKLEWSEDARKHVVIRKLELLETAEFFNQVNDGNSDSTLVFIHGFNVAFDDALRRTAQLAADLDYDGVPISYSWPSRGNVIAYTGDEANVGWTVPHLERFLTELRTRGGRKRIHVVAHSMGNRALLGVVERLGLSSNSDTPLLSRVVMAAPDVDSLEFNNRYSSLLQRVAAATVVYGSPNDKALQMSESIHGYDRLGLVSHHFGSERNIDMIDISPLDLSMLGHNYYGENPIILNDMKAFLNSYSAASTRPWLRPEPASMNHRVIWKFGEQSKVLQARQLTR